MAVSMMQTIVQDSAADANWDLLDAERTVYSKMIELAAMPVLRYEQFAINKTELLKEPGSSITLSYWQDLPEDYNQVGGYGVGWGWATDPNVGQTNPERKLIEGIPIQTETLQMQKEHIWIGEYGRAVRASRLTTRAAYVNWIRDSIKILGRDYAKAVDHNLRNYVFGMRADGSGVDSPGAAAAAPASILRDWDPTGLPATRSLYTPAPAYYGTPLSNMSASYEVYGYSAPGVTAANRAGLGPNFKLTPEALANATEWLAINNVPKLPGGYWGCFIHPHQITDLKLDADFRRAVIDGGREASDIYNGVLGIYDGIVFFEYSRNPVITDAPGAGTINWASENGFTSLNNGKVYGALVFGDEFLGRASALPVELVTDGIHDFGREIKLGWYGIWGLNYLMPFYIDRAVPIWTT